jgi:hypothetical protein
MIEKRKKERTVGGKSEDSASTLSLFWSKILFCFDSVETSGEN